MQDLMNQIKKGLENNLYYLSLFAALTLPDICGALESKNGKASKKGYENWFTKYIGPKYIGHLESIDCYLFRCSLLHQGRTQHLKSKYTRILFIEPNSTTNIFKMAKIDGSLTIDVKLFCYDIIDGVENWLKVVENNPNFIVNSKKLIKRYPNGLAPFIGGVPVIS